MKKQPKLFVIEDKLCTKADGVVMVITHLRRFTPEGKEKMSLTPYVVDYYVVLVELGPVSVSRIYKNGIVRQLMVPRGYEYTPVLSPFPPPKKKRPRR